MLIIIMMQCDFKNTEDNKEKEIPLTEQDGKAQPQHSDDQVK